MTVRSRLYWVGSKLMAALLPLKTLPLSLGMKSYYTKYHCVKKIRTLVDLIFAQDYPDDVLPVNYPS